jgi:hypothetical protein
MKKPQMPAVTATVNGVIYARIVNAKGVASLVEVDPVDGHHELPVRTAQNEELLANVMHALELIAREA